MINDYQAKETVTRLKKVYSIVNQAYLRALNDNGPLNSWILVNSTNPEINPDTGKPELSEISLANENLFWSKMLPYLQAMKTDLGKEKLYVYQYKYLNGSGDNDLIPRLILNDGVILAGGTFNNISCGKKAKCGDLAVDINGLAKPNVVGRDIFIFYILNDRIVPAGGSDESSISIRTFSDYCLRNDAKAYNGYGCAAWVIYNENMDYLKCDGLSWSGKHKCK